MFPPFFVSICVLQGREAAQNLIFGKIPCDKLPDYSFPNPFCYWVQQNLMTGQGGYTIKFIFASLPELYTGFLEEHSSPNSAVQLYRGVYLILNSYFSPLPFLIYIFSPTEIYYNEGVLPQAKNFETFFSNFVYFKSIGDKIFILFTNMGKICIAPLFLSPFNHFFPPICYLAIFSEKYTPLQL